MTEPFDGDARRSDAASDAPTRRPPLGPEARERLREGVTMALYIGLSLLAVLVALPPDVGPESSESPALVVLLTSLGLIAAHILAFRVSTRLVSRGELSAEALGQIGAQVAGGLVVTAVAVVPVLLVEGPTGLVIAELLLLGLIGVVSYATARSARRGRSRALAYVGIVVGIALLVVGLKTLVH